MLNIRFTSGEACDLEATPAEHRAVSEKIKKLASNGQGTHPFPADTSVSPEPHDRLLSQLIVRITDGPVCAMVEGDTLIIEAGDKFLAPFASFFNFSDDTPHGYHHHHEYWEGNDHVSPNSMPLVITAGQNSARRSFEDKSSSD